MEEVGATVNEEGAAGVGNYTVRRLQPQSSQCPQCPLLATIKTEQEATFNRKLKCVFLSALGFSLLFDIAFGLPLNSGSISNIIVYLSILVPTDWKTSIIIVIIAGLVYVGLFLRKQRKQKKTSDSAPAREVCVQISAAVQQV